jgi:ubiquinone/menaquinone biosynthesis C-methylase UbiE
MIKPPDEPAIAAAYDRWAKTYDLDPKRTRDLAAAVLRQSDLGLAGHTVIEIGCGTGYNSHWLVERARTLVALDFSKEMLREAKARVALSEHLFRTARCSLRLAARKGFGSPSHYHARVGAY